MLSRMILKMIQSPELKGIEPMFRSESGVKQQGGNYEIN